MSQLAKHIEIYGENSNRAHWILTMHAIVSPFELSLHHLFLTGIEVMSSPHTNIICHSRTKQLRIRIQRSPFLFLRLFCIVCFYDIGVRYAKFRRKVLLPTEPRLTMETGETS